MDGLFGPRTEAATLRFQHGHGLPASGVLDPRTLRVLLPVQAPAGRPSGVKRAPVPALSPAQARPKETPSLPTLPLLIALAVLGVAVTTASYVVTGRRLREQR